jgi:nucleoside 2-deoxyribosyltransferase
MPNRKLLIVGEVFVDTYLSDNHNSSLVRLGGIFHSARGCDALNIPYGLAYYAPLYLKRDIEKYSCMLQSQGTFELGYIDKSPNVMIVKEPKEVGDQGYEDLLKNQAEVINTCSISEVISYFNPTDILIYPGKYDLQQILFFLKGSDIKVHIDFHYDSETLLDILDFKVETALISTSSYLFRNNCKGSLIELKNLFSNDRFNTILLKENRGGSCFYKWDENILYESPSYFIPTVHSVGVGDCFNSVFIGLENSFLDCEARLKISALCSSTYASTFDHEEFKTKVNNMNFQELLLLTGTRLPWEERENKDIYIAGPDFPNVDTSLISKLSECLSYHNFKIHLPIRENGLITNSSTFDEKYKTYLKDVSLIENCDLLIAVLLYNDPGTLVELGMFKQSKKPTILFDPFNICKNMFLQNTPDYLCNSIEDVLNSTFECLKRK